MNASKPLAIAAAAALVSACSTAPERPAPPDTAECQTWLRMSTAPMAPDAVQRLREKCESSRE